MGLLETIRAGVKTADKITKPLQATIKHQAWVGNDGFGNNLYDSPITRRAIVEYRLMEHRMSTGEVITVKGQVTIVGPVPPNGADGRREPIDPRDLITLPDGTVSQIVDVGGFIDAKTGRPVSIDIWLS